MKREKRIERERETYMKLEMEYGNPLGVGSAADVLTSRDGMCVSRALRYVEVAQGKQEDMDGAHDCFAKAGCVQMQGAAARFA